MSDTVFVSYSRRESQLVAPVVESLISSGVKVWLDQSSIPVSVPWMDEIVQAIRGASLVVICESLDWHSSPNCAVELQIAERFGKRVLYVDAATLSGAEISELVRAELGKVDDGERLLAELLARSFRWSRSGRHSSYLAGGKVLRRYRRIHGLAASRADSADPDTLAFLRASRRRERRRRTLGASASLATFLLLLGPSVFNKATEELQHQLSDATTRMNRQLAMQRAIAFNGYVGLAKALQVTSDGKDTFSTRSSLSLSLSTELPRTYVTGHPPSGFGHAHNNRTPSGVGGGYATVATGSHKVLIHHADGSVSQRFYADGPVSALAWRGDGRQIAIADESGVHVVDARRGGEVVVLRGATHAGALRWLGDDSLEAWTSDGHRATWIWSRVHVLAHKTTWWFMDTAQAPDGTVAAVSRDGSVVALDGSSGRISTATEVHGGPATAIAAIPSGWIVAVAGQRPALVEVMRSGRKVRISAPGCVPSDVTWSPALQAVVVGCGAGGRYATWRTASRHLEMHNSPLIDISAVATARDGGVILAGGPIEYAKLGPTGQASVLRGGDPGCLDGARQMLVTGSGTIFATGAGVQAGCSQELIPSDNGVVTHSLFLPSLKAAEARGLAISHDGSMLAIGASDGSVEIIRPGDFALLQIDHFTGSEIRGIEFAKDDASMIVVTRDGDVFRVPVHMARKSMADGRRLAKQRLAQGRSWGLVGGIQQG